MNRRSFLKAVLAITSAAPLAMCGGPAYTKVPEFEQLCGWQKEFVAAVCEGRPIQFHTPMRAGKSFVVQWLRDHPEANPLHMLVFERQMSVASIPGVANYPMGWKAERRLVTLEQLMRDVKPAGSRQLSRRYDLRHTHPDRS